MLAHLTCLYVLVVDLSKKAECLSFFPHHWEAGKTKVPTPGEISCAVSGPPFCRQFPKTWCLDELAIHSPFSSFNCAKISETGKKLISCWT